jgi:hypothetical protein
VVQAEKMISLFNSAVLGKELAKSEIKIIENEPASLLFAVIKTNNKVHCNCVIRRTVDYTHVQDCDVSE